MKPITIYWSKLGLQDFASSPSPVRYDVFQKNIESSYFYTCPAFKDSMHNVFSIKANKSFYFNFDSNELKNQYSSILHSDRYDDLKPIGPNLYIARDPQLKNHVNIIYDQSFIFFADQPLEAKFTAPYLPPTSPSSKSMLAQGQFNIGQWYRRYNLEYFVPIETDSWSYDVGDSLFFVEFKTDKQIIFKEYEHEKSTFLQNTEQDLVNTLHTMPKGSSLLTRYNMFNEKRLAKQIIAEIQKVTVL